MNTLLLVLHAASAVVLIGASTHHAVLVYGTWRGRPARVDLQRVYVSVMVCLYLPTMAVGLVLYPDFRLGVRARRFDVDLPVASGFFEVKEHWVALGLFALLALWPISRRLDPRQPTPDARAYLALSLVVTTVVWWAFFTGLTLTALEPV